MASLAGRLREKRRGKLDKLERLGKIASFPSGKDP